MLKFLVVDDDEIIRAMVKSILKKKFDCEVFEANNGRTGLEVIEKNMPDIILLDLMMPVMDGVETLDAIRANSAYKNIPVIVITAVGDREIIRNLSEKKITDYILKPIDVSNTVDRIQKMINRLNETKTNDLLDKKEELNSKVGLMPILIVDTDTEFKAFFYSILNENFTIYLASNVTEGLSIFANYKPKYIFMSNSLGLLDKTLLTQKIRETVSDKEVSIYLLTDNTKLLTTRVFSYDGIVKKTMDKKMFLKDIYSVMERFGLKVKKSEVQYSISQ
ncbi:MAG: response regulator [Ignavibacteriales bacterium]|nr:response regulator [Ignavibacteriales bacterium]